MVARRNVVAEGHLGSASKASETRRDESAGSGNRVLRDKLSSTTPAADANRDPSPFSGGVPVTYESREARISRAAYHKAEQRGFEPGHEVEDWLSAEREIERQGTGD
jgi:hypothetical protein